MWNTSEIVFKKCASISKSQDLLDCHYTWRLKSGPCGCILNKEIPSRKGSRTEQAATQWEAKQTNKQPTVFTSLRWRCWKSQETFLGHVLCNKSWQIHGSSKRFLFYILRNFMLQEMVRPSGIPYPDGALIEYVRRESRGCSEHGLCEVSMGVCQRWWWNKGVTFPIKLAQEKADMEVRRQRWKEQLPFPQSGDVIGCCHWPCVDLEWEFGEKYMQASCCEKRKLFLTLRASILSPVKKNNLHLCSIIYIPLQNV